MSKARITFKRIIQNYQEIGTDDENMVSRIFLDLSIGSKEYQDLYVDVKQTVGSPYDGAPLEVGPVQGDYKGPFNHVAFQKEAEDYYRETFKKTFGIAPGGKLIAKNNQLIFPKTVYIDID